MGFKGIPGGGNLQALSQQAKKMMKELESAQAELHEFQSEGSAGGGAVKIIINGKYEVQSVTIAKEAVDPNDVVMLQDLIMTATNDALTKVRTQIETRMSKATGGFALPGMF